MEYTLTDITKCDVFTPDNISMLMSSKLHMGGSLLEPSVGNGNLLKFIDLEKYTDVDVFELKAVYLDEITQPSINKFNEDFLKSPINKKYDNIIMNPPYIKVQDLPEEYRAYLKRDFKVLKSGIIDIYYAFIVKCLDLLSDDGIMVAITPNAYLYNKSSLNLRKFLFDNQYVEEIIDFKDAKVFDKISVYCCITIFTKKRKSHLTYNNKTISYSDIIGNYSLFNFNINNRLLSSVCKITNGIATLRDGIFIHESKLFDEECWKPITNGNIEKFIIYPYDNGKIIEETIFRNANPLTYDYLSSHKDELMKRDKGKKTYPAWYAYGRSQSIKYVNETCIYIPCFIDSSNIENCLTIKDSILHYSCLRISPLGDITIPEILNYITKNADFIKSNSSKKSGGWINISSRILYQIPLD
jgi:hypothetical protein